MKKCKVCKKSVPNRYVKAHEKYHVKTEKRNDRLNSLQERERDQGN